MNELSCFKSKNKDFAQNNQEKIFDCLVLNINGLHEVGRCGEFCTECKQNDHSTMALSSLFTQPLHFSATISTELVLLGRWSCLLKIKLVTKVI